MANVPFLKTIPDQSKVAQLLKGSLESGSFATALLFVGPRGAGKVKAAVAVAATLTCPFKGCGSCPTCLGVERGTYPDVLRVTPEGDSITVDQVREVREEASLKPYESKLRVVIFEEADALTNEAAAALLKIIEEPPPNSIFILVCKSTENLVPTITSRCQMIRFNSLPRDRLVEWIVRETGVSEEEADLYARLSGGDWREAVDLTSRENQEFRRHVFSIIERAANFSRYKVLNQVGQLVQKVEDRLTPLKEKQIEELEEAKGYFKDGLISSNFLKVFERKQKRQLKADQKQFYKRALFYLESCFRDILIYLETRETKNLVNQDYLDQLVDLAQNISSKQASKAWEFIRFAQRALEANAQFELVFEVTLLKLRGILRVE